MANLQSLNSEEYKGRERRFALEKARALTERILKRHRDRKIDNSFEIMNRIREERLNELIDRLFSKKQN